FNALAHSDKMHRQAEFVRDGDENAATRRAVELGHHEACAPCHIPEYFHLRERVLPDRRVEHEQDGMGGGSIHFFHHAHNLFELGHQHRLVLKASGGVNQYHVGFRGTCLHERIKSQTGGGRTGLPCQDGSAAARSPQLQLI